jgi:hypothetical protein
MRRCVVMEDYELRTQTLGCSNLTERLAEVTRRSQKHWCGGASIVLDIDGDGCDSSDRLVPRKVLG